TFVQPVHPRVLRGGAANRIRLEGETDRLLAEETEDLAQHLIKGGQSAESVERCPICGVFPGAGIDLRQDVHRLLYVAHGCVSALEETTYGSERRTRPGSARFPAELEGTRRGPTGSRMQRAVGPHPSAPASRRRYPLPAVQTGENLHAAPLERHCHIRAAAARRSGPRGSAESSAAR